MSESKEEIDFEQYRKPYELDEHWQLRKEFLQTYQHKYELNRLLCLAQTFINIEILGNTYSDDVMAEIRQLADNLDCVEQFRSTKQNMANSKKDDLKHIVKKAKFNSSAQTQNHSSQSSSQNYTGQPNRRTNFNQNQRHQHPPSFPINRNNSNVPSRSSAYEANTYYNQPPPSVVHRSSHFSNRPPLNLPYANRKTNQRPDYDDIPSYDTV